MQPEMQKFLRLPVNMQTTRYRPPASVPLPEGLTETPLIHPDDPASKQIQQVWTAKAKVFNLDDPVQLLAYEAVWQRICDAQAQMSENQIHYNEKTGAYTAFCRWAEFSFKLPGDAIPPASAVGRSTDPPSDAPLPAAR